MAEILSLIASAKDLYDVVHELYTVVRKDKPDVEVSSELKRSLLGSSSKAQDVSAKLSQMISKKAVPFLLRLGSNFRLPADITKWNKLF